MNLSLLNSRKMSESSYRATDALSRSELWRINTSPEHFKWYQKHPPEPTDSLLFGSLVHKAILEPESFGDEYAILPDIDRRTKAGKEQYDTFLEQNAGKTIVSPKMAEQAANMTLVATRNPLVKTLLDGPHEIPFFWEDQELPIPYKCRVDGLVEIDDRIVIVDYKSAANAATEKFSTDAFRHGYHLQAAFYSEGVKQSLELNYTPEFIFIVQEKKAPFAVNVIKASEGFMQAGRDKMYELIDIYHECCETNIWYGYNGFSGEENETILPGWVQLGIDEEEEDT